MAENLGGGASGPQRQKERWWWNDDIISGKMLIRRKNRLKSIGKVLVQVMNADCEESTMW